MQLTQIMRTKQLSVKFLAVFTTSSGAVPQNLETAKVWGNTRNICVPSRVIRNNIRNSNRSFEPPVGMALPSTASLVVGEQEEAGPSYALFRKHAAFVPELADFALSERQLGRLLAEYGLDASAGLGLGDVRILFQQLQSRGHLTFGGFDQLRRVLNARRKRVQQRLQEEREAAERSSRARWEVERSYREYQERPLGYRADEDEGLGLRHGATSSHTWQQQRSMTRDDGTTGAPHHPQHHTPAVAQHTQQPSLQLHNTGPAPHPSASAGFELFTELLRPIINPSSPGPYPSPSSPGNAWTAAATRAGARPSTAPGGAWTRSSLAGLTPSSAAAGGLEDTAVIMTSKDPPVLLREAFPTPPCEFPHVRSQLRGVREMVSGPDARHCLNALRELYADWELAVEEKKAKEELKRSRKKVEAPVAPPSSQLPPASSLLPPEGSSYLLLTAACCCVSLRQFDVARRLLQTAESKFPTQTLGVEHPYYYCTFFLQGVAGFHEGQYEDAISKFEAARDLADLAARAKTDPTARKNVGCCFNNIGVCCHMLGRRSEAVAAFREAVRALHNPCGLHAAVADAAKANLAKSVRISFAMPLRPRSASVASASAPGAAGVLRPVSARPLSATGLGTAAATSGLTVGVPGMPVTVSAAGGKLQAFLRQAVTMPPPTAVAMVPKWASRSDGEEAMRKAQAKAKGKGKEPKKDAKDGKGKAAKKKPKGFQISYAMPYYDMPTFGVANVSLAAKKKAKKKAPAAK